MNILSDIVAFEPFWTVICGVVVYLVCEYAKNTWVDALQKYKQLKSEIAYLLGLHENKYANPIDIALYDNSLPPDYAVASAALREIACRLSAFIEVLPKVHWGIPNKRALDAASANLVGLSNGFSLPYNCPDSRVEQIQHNESLAKEVRALLRLYTK